MHTRVRNNCFSCRVNSSIQKPHFKWKPRGLTPSQASKMLTWSLASTEDDVKGRRMKALRLYERGLPGSSGCCWVSVWLCHPGAEGGSQPPLSPHPCSLPTVTVHLPGSSLPLCASSLNIVTRWFENIDFPEQSCPWKSPPHPTVLCEQSYLILILNVITHQAIVFPNVGAPHTTCYYLLSQDKMHLRAAYESRCPWKPIWREASFSSDT